MTKVNNLAVTITTSKELTEVQHKRLIELLKTKFGQSVVINEIIDPDTLGGVKVTIGDQVYDATVSGTLERLQPVLQLVTITTSEPLTNSQRKKLTSKLEEKLTDAFQLKEVVDDKVIGGLRLTIGSLEYDGTIRKSLNLLKRSLTQ